MRAPCSFEYAIVRVVPRVEREEFVNVGVAVFSEERELLAAKIELDERRLCLLCPTVDVDALEVIAAHLAAIPRICEGGAAAGPLAELSRRERWRWLTAPRSTIVQMSAPHGGVAERPEEWLDRLLDVAVRIRRP